MLFSIDNKVAFCAVTVNFEQYSGLGMLKSKVNYHLYKTRTFTGNYTACNCTQKSLAQRCEIILGERI
jgi:hypothetical protein